MKEDTRRNTLIVVAIILATLLFWFLSTADEHKIDAWVGEQLRGNSFEWVTYVVLFVLCGSALVCFCLICSEVVRMVEEAVSDFRDRRNPVMQRTWELNQAARELKEAAGARGFDKQGWYWLELLEEEANAVGSVTRASEILMADISSWSEDEAQAGSVASCGA